jgi:hypothetical protein
MCPEVRRQRRVGAAVQFLVVSDYERTSHLGRKMQANSNKLMIND